jgi:hypothetical protein
MSIVYLRSWARLASTCRAWAFSLEHHSDTYPEFQYPDIELKPDDGETDARLFSKNPQGGEVYAPLGVHRG